MDSFTMLFQVELGASELAGILQAAGFDARTQGTDRVVVSSGDAYIWIVTCRLEDLDPSDLEDESEWPIRRNQVKALLDISVRRNGESEDLAMKVADRLVTQLAGAIIWDGMDEWERLYKAYLTTK